MTPLETAPADRRILIFTSLASDAALAERLLADAGFETRRCASLAELGSEIELGAGAALITEEALRVRGGGLAALSELLESQPIWSALPIILVSGAKPFTASERRALRYLEQLRNITLLPRPLHVRSLISTVRVALQSREHQYAIRDLVAELRESVRQRDSFLALLAHELRNPLATLSNAVQILGLRRPQLDAELRWASEAMERQVGQLSRLVDDLLDVARVTQNKIELRREAARLGDVLDRAAETVAGHLRERGQSLHDRSRERDREVYVDVARFTQILSNLLHNASKYSSKGGDIWLEAAADRETLQISVRDDGIGLDEEHLESIFDMFEQVDSTITRAAGGLGLGLTLVKNLTEMHGGRVEVSSAGPGRGSCFTLNLPLTALRPAAADAPSGVQATPTTGGRRILVVDDNADAADSFSMLLTALGHEVSTVYTGGDALTRADEFGPDIVFLDISMPDLDGYAVARELRQRATLATVTLVAVSGLEQLGDRARRADFDHHLLKPVDLDAVEQLLAEI